MVEEAEDYGEPEQIQWGFRSKVTEGGKAPKKKKPKKQFYEKKLKKPGIAKYIPKPIPASPTAAYILGIPDDEVGRIITPVQPFKKSEALKDIFGWDIKIGKNGKRKVF